MTHGLGQRLHVGRKGELVPIFKLRLHNGGSIGPDLLKEIWASAVGSERVGVARTSTGPSGVMSYVVTAPATPADVCSVEKRLRFLLQQKLATAYIQLTRLA